jgi:Sulfotransferase family
MYVNPEKQFAFIHIPKTGGVSIVKNILEPLGVDRVGGFPRHHAYRPDLFEPDWFVFAFVRNPYTRAVSLYRHQTFKNKKGRTDNGVGAFLTGLIEEYAETGRPMVQAKFVGPLVDIYRFEDFDNEVAKICKRLGVKKPFLPKDPRNNYYGEYKWRMFVNDDDISVINEIFREDFETFGYKMIRK